MTTWTRALDEAAEEATGRGYWHVLLFYLLCGLAAVPTSFLVFAQVFTSATPEHWCAPPPELEALALPEAVLRNLTVPQHGGHYDKCSSYILDTKAMFAALHDYIDERNEILRNDGGLRLINPHQLRPAEGVEEREEQIAKIEELIPLVRGKETTCKNGWRYSRKQYTDTLVTEYSLVCDKEWLAQISYTLFWVGSIIGNVFFGWMSDRFGRRFTIMFMIYIEVPLAIAASFPNSYTMYMVLRFVGGLFFPALYQQPFILALELMPADRRTNVGIIVGMLFASGISLLALVAYAIRDWFQLSLATSVPFIFLYGYYWVIPESPRWLVGKGRLEEAEKVYRALAKNNGIELSPGFLLDIHKRIASEHKIDEKSSMLPTNNDRLVISPEIVERDDVDYRIKKVLALKPDIGKVYKNDMDNGNKEKLLLNNTLGNNVKRIDYLPNDLEGVIEPLSPETEQKMGLRNDIPARYLNKKPFMMFNRMIFKNTEADDTKNRIMDNNSIEEDCKVSILDIFRYPNIRKKFLISTLDWISLGVIYNTLSYNTSNLGVNDHMAFFIGGVVEIPSYILAWRCMERFGRRWVLCIFMLIGGASCLCCGLVPEDMPWVTVALAMFGKLCAAAAFAVFYVLIGELLPTVVRAQAIGLSSFVTGIGLLTCPYIAHLAVYGRTLPLIMMGVLSIVAGIAPLFLPETLNQPLPQTLRDGEMFGRNIKIFSFV